MAEEQITLEGLYPQLADHSKKHKGNAIVIVVCSEGMPLVIRAGIDVPLSKRLFKSLSESEDTNYSNVVGFAKTTSAE